MERASFELRDDEIESLRARLQSCSNSSSRSSIPPPRRPAADETITFEEWQAKHPCALTNFTKILSLLKGKRLAVFLDYDGTLTPIVPNPEDAILSDEMRAVVRGLAQQFPTAIISGRGREKVENFVQLKELYYAGSHGMDIAGPQDIKHAAGSSCDSSFQPAAHFRPLIDKVYEELCDRLVSVPGSYVEHNNFCVSAHYRNCPGESWLLVVKAVEETLAGRGNEELRITRGRKVVEIRPKVNWHKGTALNHLLDVLGLKAQPDVVAIYIGDDRTDEDAFKVLLENNQGYGILVSSKVKETAAKFTVQHPDEVMRLLKGLVDWAASEDNAWQGEGAAGSIWQPERRYDAIGATGVDKSATLVSPLLSRSADPDDDAAAAGTVHTKGVELHGGMESSAEQLKWKEWQQHMGHREYPGSS
ncbi:hypothetical protein CEUSTIGMA_g5591.t1 [Chlamydomonas eustigma]|uniref:Trehalose 6-phosphate phosphatase n=1 Tax=Chlamydomonas eustigma TaxID=1157962 RepID=A0A250X5F3_9CHLO|nr:hypothetical protein CEUSTIGMA_g5591.t1 [Chlamydomonas eustigma]|eukprot:GAX78149.1 hypothetical protein CEUSTIGMA_g5591.t1 [Chlamydomonas eustigma]